MADIPVNRREFLATTALAGAVVQSGAAVAQTAVSRGPASTADAEIVWIDGAAPSAHEGQTWGVPWPKGARSAKSTFALAGGGAVQTWPTAYWPDGSLKWTAHAIPAGEGGPVRVVPGRTAATKDALTVREAGDVIEVSSGRLRWRIGKTGEAIIASARHGDRETVRDVKLVALVQDRPDGEDGQPVATALYTGTVTGATVEQRGPVRAVVKLEGTHRGAGRDWLPFTLRLYFHAGSERVRIVHSFIFDGDENKDFIRGLGLTGAVPMSDLMHDRHVRFAGGDDGVWGEAVRPLTGLRRDPGAAYRTAQVAGEKTGPVSGMSAQVRGRLDLIAAWGDFTLNQGNSDGFHVRKRTKPGHGWIDVDSGARANGLGFVGGPAGGVAFGMADFWQRSPVRLDIRDAHTDAAQFTTWFHSPETPAMDLRFYHDGMGMVTHPQENEGLEITYEDYEKGWGTPQGIARTTELMIWALPATPTRARFAEMAMGVATPPRLMCSPARLHAAGVLGDWGLVDRSTPTRTKIEDQNDYLLAFYLGQAEQRRWYGFWSYGDVMHSYDLDRHVWKYDIGGFAWANSELSPDLWLWYSFLRSGRGDVFRFAEAMTRHTSEVDVYHTGPYRGLGTRHGVQHWGDSSKQPRVSNAANRRIYYYLTADERIGDLMRALVGSDEALTRVAINRKVGARAPSALPPGGTAGMGVDRAAPPAGQINMGFGTSWSALAAAWLTEWERTGDTKWRDRIVNGMTTIAALPKQWFAGGSNYELATGRFTGPGDRVSLSHLNAVFGCVETHSELFQVIDVPAYKTAWLDYCAYYNASEEAFQAKTGAPARGRNLRQGHSRLTAYAAAQTGDAALARRAWGEFFGGEAGLGLDMAAQARRITGPAVLKPIDEAPRVSTNGTAQWGLAAIQNLALVGGDVEAAFEATPATVKRGRPGGE